MLHFTPCSKSGQQNLQEEETASKMTTCNCHKSRSDCQKLRPSYGWSMTIISLGHITTTPGISHPSILHILTKVLAMRKVSVRLVPRGNWPHPIQPKPHPIQHLSWLFALFLSQIQPTFWRDLWLVFPLLWLIVIVGWASANCGWNQGSPL